MGGQWACAASQLSVKVTVTAGACAMELGRTLDRQISLNDLPEAAPGIAHSRPPGTAGKIEKRERLEARAARTSLRTRAEASGGTVKTTGRLYLRMTPLG